MIVMEYAAGGELYDYISRKRQLNEDETKSLFRQVVSAVRYCHKVGSNFSSFHHPPIANDRSVFGIRREIRFVKAGLVKIRPTALVS